VKALARWIVALYPLAYRRRYGAEMEALLEDSEVRASTVVDLAKGAAVAHLRPLPGLAGEVPTGERVRAGAIGLLACWLLFVLAGLGFYKTTEGFSPAGDDHLLLGGSHLAVELLAIAGSLAVATAIVPFAFAVVLRARGEAAARGAVALAAASLGALVLATAGLVAAAHVSPSISAVVALALLGGWTVVAVGAGLGCLLAARRGLFSIPIGRGGLVLLAALGGVVAVTMAAMAAAAAIYLVALVSDVPNLGAQPNGPLGLLSATASLAIQLVLMLVATALAARAAWHGRTLVYQ
jgi:hypothetical protein